MTVLVDDQFIDTPATPLINHTPDVGGPWTESATGFVIQPSGTVSDISSGAHHAAFISVASDNYKITFNDVKFVRGSAPARWNAVVVASSGNINDSTFQIRPNGSAADPELKLFTNTTGTAENWGSGLVVADGIYDIVAEVDYPAKELRVWLDGSPLNTFAMGALWDNALSTGSTVVGFYTNVQTTDADEMFKRMTVEDLNAPTTNLKRWTGSTLVDATLQRWNGTTYDPGSLSVA